MTPMRRRATALLATAPIVLFALAAQGLMSASRADASGGRHQPPSPAPSRSPAPSPPPPPSPSPTTAPSLPPASAAVLSSVLLDPALVQTGTTQSSLWVYFSAGLPPEGALVTFTSSNPQLATIPSPVTIPGFGASGLLPVTISPSAVGVVTLSARWNGVTASADLTVTATSLFRITTPSVLPNARVGENYAGFIEACCGQGGPYTWSLVSGSVPAGLKFAGNSLRLVQTTGVTGVPTTVQTRSFTVRARDAAGNTSTRTFSITVDPPSPLIINNQSGTLTDGKVGVAYATGLFPLGGTPPWSWSLVGGQLPPGLSVQASPGRVLGTPTTAGTFTFTVRVADSAGQTATGPFTITVLP